MTKLHLLLGFFVIIAWGFNAVVFKFVVTNIPPLFYFGLRLLLTSILLLPFIKVEKKNIKHLFNISVLMHVLFGGLALYSLLFLTASSYSLLLNLEVPISVLLAVILLKEQIKLKEVIGISISLIGVLILFGMPDVSLTGVALITLGTTSMGLANIEMTRIEKMNPLTFTFYTSIFAVPFLLLLSFIFEKPSFNDFSNIKLPLFLSVVFYQIVIVSAAIAIWQMLLSKNDANKVVPLLLLQPIFSIIGGVLFFKDKLSLSLVIGGIIITCGVYLTMENKKQSLSVDK